MREIVVKAFDAVPDEFVRRCYAHVEEQEAFYRLLDGIQPLNVEEIDTVEETPEEDAPTAVEGALIFEDDQVLVQVSDNLALAQAEANIEEVVVEVIPTLELDAETVTTHACSLCDYVSPSLPKLTKHEKSHHKCDECGKMFHRPNGSRDFKNHLKTHQPKTPKPAKPSKPRKPRKKKSPQNHECSICQKSFPFLSYLDRHMEDTHGSTLKRKIDFQVENDLPSNSTTIPLVSSEQPKKRHRKQQLVERKEI